MNQLKQIKLSTPTYSDAVPSSGKAIKLKPFRVADEKTLLIAAESKNTKQMMNAMRDVVSNCTEGADVDEFASFDLEYLFIKLRSVSVGETAEVMIKCKECEKGNKVNVDISDVGVVKEESHTKEIKISDEVMFIMKYPDITNIEVSTEVDAMMDIIIESIDTVIFGEEAIKITDAEKGDLKDIINDMTTKQFAEVRSFFETMPKLKKEISFQCKECSHENEITLEGMADFF